MTTPETPEFSLENEIQKLREYLSLPITNVEFDESYEYGKTYRKDNLDLIWINARLYVNDDMIGTIPYFSFEHGYGYDISNISELAWDKIYGQSQQVIFDKILHQEPLAIAVELVEIEWNKYLILNIKDKDGILIRQAQCTFTNGDWNIFVYDLNAVTTTKTQMVKVTLNPPPPLKK